MSVIQVCVGSSCHMKGSYRVIQTYKRLIQDYSLDGIVELKASFCMQRCTGGIGITFDDVPVDNLTMQNCESIFKERIIDKL